MRRRKRQEKLGSLRVLCVCRKRGYSMKNNKIKEKFVGIMGNVGVILWSVFSIIFVSVPILATDLPWWGMLIIFVLIVFTDFIGAFVNVGTYIYACIVMINSEFTIFSVVFFVDLILYLVFMFIPGLIDLIINFVGSKR